MRHLRPFGLLRAVLATAVLLGAASPALGAPKVRSYGRAIDALGAYDGASVCDPDPEPGVVSFQRMVLRAYPGTGAGSISRECDGHATSEHHEGRAWDWGVNVDIPSQKKAAEDVIKWLLKKDKYGNSAAMARRTGIMYLIWNRRWWSTWNGWDVYCKQKKGRCVDPEDGHELSPHTDHVHFSFTWQGAAKQTTFWNRSRSLVSSIETEPGGDGYLLAGRNGSVIANRAAYYGSKEQHFPDKKFIDIATTKADYGYWMMNSKGHVVAVGGVKRHGDVSQEKLRPADLESAPSSTGYWIVSHGGRVFAFGKAKRFGDARERDVNIVAMAVRPRADGYWLLASDGTAFAFGRAKKKGDLGSGVAVDIASTPSGDGYWIVTDTGKVKAFGDARHFGDVSEPTTPIKGIAPTPTGKGYRLVTKLGEVLLFGDAK